MKCIGFTVGLMKVERIGQRTCLTYFLFERSIYLAVGQVVWKMSEKYAVI